MFSQRHFMSVFNWPRLASRLSLTLDCMTATLAPAQSTALENAASSTRITPSIHTAFEVPPQPTVEGMRAALTLADLEALVQQNNPALSVARANIKAARGRQVQGGLRSNPRLGYF